MQLHEVWEKVRLNFRLKTEITKYKTNLKLSLKPKSRVTAVVRSFFIHYQDISLSIQETYFLNLPLPNQIQIFPYFH